MQQAALIRNVSNAREELDAPQYVPGMSWEESMAPQARERVVAAVLAELQRRNAGKQVCVDSIPAVCLPNVSDGGQSGQVWGPARRA